MYLPTNIYLLHFAGFNRCLLERAKGLVCASNLNLVLQNITSGLLKCACIHRVCITFVATDILITHQLWLHSRLVLAN